MRRAAPSLALLTLLAAGCTSDQPPPGTAVPTGPCAAAREQPPDGSQEQRQQGDLDGDGRTDEVVSWVRDGERVVQAWLATGETAAPEALVEGDLLATADVDGDGRAEVFAAADPTTGSLLALDGCRLVRVTQEGAPWEFPLGEGQLVCRGGGTIDLLPDDQQAGQRFQLSGTTITASGPAPAPDSAGGGAVGPVTCF